MIDFYDDFIKVYVVNRYEIEIVVFLIVNMIKVLESIIYLIDC